MDLFNHQKAAIERMKNGCILCGGVGTGKSLTTLAYYISKVCGGDYANPTDVAYTPLVIITTAKKRDTNDWHKECYKMLIPDDVFIVDSWNNIGKYTDKENCFFIFDEQRLVGSGAWVKSFLKISKKNQWVLLSATPGDNWLDYIPVFVANKFYKHRTDFLRQHVVFSRFTTYPKVDRYIDTLRLLKLRDSITVNMDFVKDTIPHHKDVTVGYDEELYSKVVNEKWNFVKDCPIQQAGEEYYLVRRVSNSHESRVKTCMDLTKWKGKVIIFYNFNYELALLREALEIEGIEFAEWNGQKHQDIPSGDRWAYLVQYTAGAEGWECIDTDTIIFFSLNPSYKISVQASGRIDRLNTPFTDLYFYHLVSGSVVDKLIQKALRQKKSFNETDYIKATDVDRASHIFLGEEVPNFEGDEAETL